VDTFKDRISIFVDTIGKQIITGLFLGYLFLSLSFLLPTLVSVLILKKNLGEMILTNPENLSLLDKIVFQMIQGMHQVVGWGLSAWILAKWVGEPKEFLGLKKSNSITGALLVPLIVLASVPLVQSIMFDEQSFNLPSFMAGLENQIHQLEYNGKRILSALLADDRLGVFIGNVVFVALTPAICEELFFRGFLQGRLAKLLPPHLAIWFTALLFSLMHMQFYGFFSRMFLGALLGYFVYYSGSLYLGMLGHFTFNFISIFVVYIASIYRVEDEWIDDSVVVPFPLLLASIVSFCVLFGLYRFIYAPSQKTQIDE